MSDRDEIEIIDDAFASLTAAVAHEVRGVDAGAIERKVTRRRRIHTTAFSILAVLAVALPAAVFAQSRANHGPPLANPAPDGRFLHSELEDLLEPLTDQLCTEDSPSLHLMRIVYANMDGDAGLETAGSVYCAKLGLNGEPESRVFVFDRDSHGGLVTRGPIAFGDLNRQIRELGVHPAGGIIVGANVAVAGVTEYDRYQWFSGGDTTGFRADRMTGLLAMEHFRASDLEVPAWPPAADSCRSGIVSMPSVGVALNLSVLAHADLDGNGDLETLVSIACLSEPQMLTEVQWLVYDNHTVGVPIYRGPIIDGPEIRAHGITEIRLAPDGRDILGVISKTEARRYTWTGNAYEFASKAEI